MALFVVSSAMGQVSSNTSAFPTGSGNTASTFVGVKSTRANGYKISVQGAIKLWGTGNTLSDGNYSPTIFFDNRTAGTGRKYFLQSSNEGLLRIVDSTAGMVDRLVINSSGNVGIGISSPSALFHTVGSVRHDLGSDATGDIYYRNASGMFTRLPIGTDGQVLTISSGLPAWGAGSGGGSGITSLNTLTGATQTFATGASGTDFGISSAGSEHTFNIPTASAGARGLLSSADWTTFNSKAPATGGSGYIQNGTAVQSGANFNISGSGTIGANLSVGGTNFDLGSALQPGQVVMRIRQQSNPSGNGWNFGYTSFNSSDLYMYGYENVAFRVFTNTLERFTVGANGNVGIGNGNPVNKLDVSGTTKLQGTSDAVQLTVQGNATQTTDLIRTVSAAGNTVFRVTKDGNPVWVTPTYDAVLHPAASFQPTVGYDGTNVIWGNSSPTHQISIGAIGNGYTAKPNIQFNGYSTVLNTTFGGTFTIVNPSGGFGSSSALVMAIKGTTGQTGNLMEWQNDGGAALSSVKSDGSVTIGTTNLPSGYKLAVGGNIIAEKVRVKLQSSGWPDYVFGKEYSLLSLKETERFIKLNNHLPGVPSAAEIEKSGLDLGDGQAVLLKKIEELTLHLIEMNKKVEKLILENEALKKKIDR